MKEKLIKIYSNTNIQDEIFRLAKTISNDYKGKDLVLVCILKGAKPFLKELSRHLTVPHKKTFIRVSNYGNNNDSSRKITLHLDTSLFLKNKDILIIEDIVDSGQTINFLYNLLSEKKVKSIETCSLLLRFKNKKTNLEVKYSGFLVGEGNYVGFGLDHAEKYREKPDISILIFE